MPLRTWLFRVLFPSWEFFAAVAPLARAFVRPLHDDGTRGPWREPWTPAPRRWWHLVIHPAGNLWLRRRALLDEFVDELAEGETEGASLAEQWLVASVRRFAREQDVRGLRARAWQWGVGVESEEPVWICPRLVDAVEPRGAVEPPA